MLGNLSKKSLGGKRVSTDSEKSLSYFINFHEYVLEPGNETP